MNRGFATILVLLAVVLVGGVGVGWYLSRQGIVPKFSGPATSEQPPAPPPVPGENTSPAPTGAGETANWKTYTNQEYQFSFKYPDEWRDVVTPEEKARGNPGYTNRFFNIETSNKEYITGTVFDGKAQHTTDSETVANFDIQNGKSILITYVKCMGPGCGFGVKDITTFHQILSTFRFD